MGEPRPPRNRDQDLPPATGEATDSREPIVPQPTPEPHERRPLPDEETYERDRADRRSEEEAPPVENQ
jgi:hypothetical protein